MFNTTTSIKDWAEDDRPREKLILKGRNALTDAELLAIVLGSGSKEKSAVELAQEILISRQNNLYELGKMSLNDLLKFKGVGTAKAAGILAMLEFGRRRASVETPKLKLVRRPEDAYEYVKSIFQDLEHEEFWVMGLSRSNRIIGVRMISKGGRSGTTADGKIIFKEMLDLKASACVLIHNHPSGRLEPSHADIELTKRFIEFGRLIDLPVLDHVIVADTGYYSFADNGRI